MNVSKHIHFMQTALRLARKGIGFTSPNPPVGAVIVKNGKIISSGYHTKFGDPHAEITAFKKIKNLPKNAVLYITLEPCSTYGKTPPCVDAILKSGIKHVIIATQDPNPLHQGKGIKLLKKNGIFVETGICEKEAKRLIESFTKWIRCGLPFCIVKAASSLDGKIATKTGQSKWITSLAARKKGYSIRKEVDAIMVGIHTVLKDNPELVTHEKGGFDPFKIIVDSAARTPLSSKLIQKHASRTIIATTSKASHSKIYALEKAGVYVLVLPERKGRVDLRVLFKKIGKMGISSLLVEGGGELTASILEEKLVDRLFLFYAPILIGGRNAPTFFGGNGIKDLKKVISLKDLKIDIQGEEIWMEGRF